jgi:Carboxypeptidase regulatory-like domain
MLLRNTTLVCVVIALVSAFAIPSSVLAQQGSAVNGRATDVGGTPLRGVEVSLVKVQPVMPGMTMAPPAPILGRSNPDGSFVVNAVPAGDYILQVDAPGYGRYSQQITVPTNQTFNVQLDALEIPGAEEPSPAAAAGANNQVLQERINALEQRVRDLESTTVLSEPETRTKKTTVYIDKNNNVYDRPTAGAKPTVTYQRERVYRRENINEKIEAALSEQAEHSVQVGVNAAIAPQAVFQSKGPKTDADRHAYQLASADLFFTARVAQHTLFFADVVGLSGPPPDLETGGLTLLNGFTARLVRQNELNLREAWLRTEVFSQKLSLIAGRLDLTNYFDHNAAANDETRQFLSDALVNNPTLNLAVNGSGVAMVYDPKGGFTFKLGVQQSRTEATNLSQSMYSLGEIGYVARLPGLGEGNYRVWYRTDNSVDRYRTGFGTSLDQKLAPQVTWFGRFGSTQADVRRDYFYSGGLQFANGAGFYPGDFWGVGYAHYDTGVGPKERLAEGYYNFGISEKFRLSFHLTHVLEKRPGEETVGYLVPGIRLQASF